MTRGLPAAVALVGALALWPARAVAAGDPAAAEALFAAGREALERGDFDTACAKLGESQRLDPAAGTLMNLAACNEKRGRLASAWENWRDALGMLRADDERQAVVKKRLGALEARLPRLILVLAPTAPPTSVIARDGNELGHAALGLPLPLDPGSHEIRVVAEGYESRLFAVTAEEGKTVTLSLEPGARKPTPALKPVASVPPPAPPPTRHDEPGFSARTWGLIAGGTGGVLVVAGSVTGLLALDKKSEIEDHCAKSAGKYLCDAEGASTAREGKTLAVVSTITLPAGLVLATLGTTLWLLGGSDEPAVSAYVTSEGAGIFARGAL